MVSIGMTRNPTADSRIDRRSYLSGSVALGALSLGAGPVQAGDKESDDKPDRPVTKIDECTEITEPGRYALVTDLEAEPGEHCLEIRASNVTLEGRGHTITGTDPAEPDDFPFDSGTTGVLVSPPRTDPGDGKKSKPGVERAVANVELTALTVEGFTTGIAAFETKNGRFAELTARNNEYGIGLFESANNTLESTRATGNTTAGYYLSDSCANLLTRNVAEDNEDDETPGPAAPGFWLDRLASGSSHNLLVENDATRNRIGFWLTGADENVVKANDADDNRGDPGDDAGILLENAHENTLVGNSANSCLDGIALINSRENTLKKNVANENSFDGINLVNSYQNTLVNNVANSNYDVSGIILLDSHGNTLEENTANDNAHAGITLIDAHRNVLGENTTNDNATPQADAGVYIVESHENRLSGHTANDNDAYGYRLRDADRNTGRDNTARGNELGPIEIVGGEGNRIEVNGELYEGADANDQAVGAATQDSAALSERLQMILGADDRLAALREYKASVAEQESGE